MSKCVELGTASRGESEEEALQNIHDANLLYLNTLEQLGECAEALNRLGVAVHRGEAALRRITCPPNQTVASQVIPLAAMA